MFRSALIAGILVASAWTGEAQERGPVKILLDVAPRAVEYQLQRLSNDELARVERSETDARYAPVYYALLTRRGLGREYVEEALAALTKLESASAARVLLKGLARLPAGSDEAADRLLQVLVARPAAELRAERAHILDMVQGAESPLVLRGAYSALMVADANPKAAWELASKRDGHLVALLRGVPALGGPRTLLAALAERIVAAIRPEMDPDTRLAALTALASARPDAATFRMLAEGVKTTEGMERVSAIRALNRIPQSAWPAEGLEPLARAILADLEKAPPAKRTEPATLEAVHLAEKLVDAIPDPARRDLKRDLRALGVRVVRIETIPEQMAFDLRWFVVEAGKPVQIVLYNPDAMPHNLLVIKPGSLQEVGTAASTMSLPVDPKIKPYVPDTPLVLQATRLLNWEETERLSFTAPQQPGEYPFVCTFPGHWVRMYGVMLVVPDLERWEAAPTVPLDPMTKKPFAMPRVPGMP